jgi:hypothetical protein
VKPLSDRDRKLLALWAVIVILAVYFWPSSDDTGTVGAVQSVELTERRLARLRRLAAAEPGRREILKQVSDELVKREKGLIQAETAPQAQAQLLQVVRRVAQAQQPALVFKGTEFAPPRPLGKSYGEVVMTISMDAGIEQVINFLADIGNQPELISVSELQFTQVNGKQKLVPVRVTFTGIVPRRLAPEKKGGQAF